MTGGCTENFPKNFPACGIISLVHTQDQLNH